METNSDSNLSNLSNRLRERKFSLDECFLCARSLKEFGSSSEHVFPRWLQARFNLWDQKLILLNGSSIPYRYLTVPCCDECNRYQLAPIESIISRAVDAGYSEIRRLPIKVLYLWLGKIFYGILYKELFLAMERGDPDLGSILPTSALAEFDSLLFFLHEARGLVEPVDFSAASIKTFQTQVPDFVNLQWDFSDNIETQFIACRMGHVGVIGILQDGGVHQSFMEDLSFLDGIPLHPIQFAEICARFSYLSSLVQRTPKWVTMGGSPHQTIQLPLGGFSLKPWFAEWDPHIYAQFLSHYLGYPLEMLFRAPDQVATFLRDDSGNPLFIDFEEKPQMPIRRLPDHA